MSFQYKSKAREMFEEISRGKINPVELKAKDIGHFPSANSDANAIQKASATISKSILDVPFQPYKSQLPNSSKLKAFQKLHAKRFSWMGRVEDAVSTVRIHAKLSPRALGLGAAGVLFLLAVVIMNIPEVISLVGESSTRMLPLLEPASAIHSQQIEVQLPMAAPLRHLDANSFTASLSTTLWSGDSALSPSTMAPPDGRPPSDSTMAPPDEEPQQEGEDTRRRRNQVTNYQQEEQLAPNTRRPEDPEDPEDQPEDQMTDIKAAPKGLARKRTPIATVKKTESSSKTEKMESSKTEKTESSWWEKLRGKEERVKSSAPAASAAGCEKGTEEHHTCLQRIGCDTDLVVVSGSGANMHVTIAKNVVDYTLNQILQARVIRAPYENVYISNVFEPRFYQCMMAHLPKGDSSRGMTRVSTSSNKRFIVPINRWRAPGPEEKEAARVGMNRAFWRAFAQAFGSDEFTHTWISKFQRTTTKRFNAMKIPGPWQHPRTDRAHFFKKTGQGEQTPVPNFRFEMDFARDYSGYSVAPHSDTPSKLVTVLFYLPRSQAFPGAGTLLLRSKSRKTSTLSAGGQKWGAEWTVTKEAEFAPNSVLAFAPCTSSWHGVKQVTLPAGMVRDTIQGYIHLHGVGKLKGKEACVRG